MAKRASWCYYRILQGFMLEFNHGKLQPAFATFIKRYGLIKPTLGKMLVHYLCMENNVDGALRLINELNNNNFKVNFPVDFIGMLSAQGRPLDAYRLVMGAQNDIPCMDVVDYSVLVDGLCKEGYIDKAIDICNFARKMGVILTVVTYNSVFNGLCRQNCLVEAFRLFDSLEMNNVIPSDVTYGTLIDALVREGFVLDARQLFEKMIIKNIKPNTHIFNSLIDGYCKFGNVKEALRLLYDMENHSLKPEKFTVSAVIYGFSLEGNMEAALQFFIDMQGNGFSPDFLGFLYLVRGLCAKGRMEEGRSIIREMLQDESVLRLLERVDGEMETESIERFLVHLCEQGSIQDALTILNEIGSMFFPCKRISSSSAYKPTASSEENMRVISPDALPSIHQMDFDAVYSKMTSLCSLGDLQGATALAKAVISGSTKK
ncbi:pentatricopeptide repeat-containing protein At5g57250, mitochondrial [Beta vulgaris subsp. vulgaris]|uniref:pentatricopeptide repeat-containing protein At5g57250, mitochondrial n=1 Tax=Beta vulgaris subsp. vulgaris TaxID=3555 RepID=UPI002547557E|nr:pentatricopeptide repeat-containing protein At5g57250, mitochondrial [Beta vulgaris subsp. vulgaris]